MQTYCRREGQIEIGVIEHEGRTFSALGASVIGKSISGYSKLVRGDVVLTTWCGKTMLDCRSEIVERFWSGSMALMFRLTQGRFIIGYSLGDGGLFRGELLTDCSDDDARRAAIQHSDYCSQLDAEDEYAFASESEEEATLDVHYRCPDCRHEWTEQSTSACDSECPICGTGDITALDEEMTD